MKICSRNNLNKLDWLTPQDLYCMCSKSNVTCPGVRTISFEATLGFFKRTFVFLQPALLYRTCYIVVVVFLKTLRGVGNVPTIFQMSSHSTRPL